jgi:hypothetical protein
LLSVGFGGEVNGNLRTSFDTPPQSVGAVRICPKCASLVKRLESRTRDSQLGRQQTVKACGLSLGWSLDTQSAHFPIDSGAPKSKLSGCFGRRRFGLDEFDRCFDPLHIERLPAQAKSRKSLILPRGTRAA